MSGEVGTSATGIAFRKADPSTPVHRTSGRDDKMRVFFWRECKKKKIIGRRLKIFLFFKVFPFFLRFYNTGKDNPSMREDSDENRLSLREK